MRTFFVADRDGEQFPALELEMYVGCGTHRQFQEYFDIMNGVII